MTALRRGVTSSGAMCATASSGVTPSSSLIRTHASDHAPRPDFSCSPYTERPCRLLSAPAGEWSFPTLSLCSLSRMNAPVPRCLPWCACPFLPMGRRPSSRGKNESATTITRTATSVRTQFRRIRRVRLSLFNPPVLLTTQVAPTAVALWPLGSRGVLHPSRTRVVTST